MTEKRYTYEQYVRIKSGLAQARNRHAIDLEIIKELTEREPDSRFQIFNSDQIRLIYAGLDLLACETEKSIAILNDAVNDLIREYEPIEAPR